MVPPQGQMWLLTPPLPLGGPPGETIPRLTSQHSVVSAFGVQSGTRSPSLPPSLKGLGTFPSGFPKGGKQPARPSRSSAEGEAASQTALSFFPLSRLLQNVRRSSHFFREAIPESGILNSVTSAFQEAH